jgi:hypothetical protein
MQIIFKTILTALSLLHCFRLNGSFKCKQQTLIDPCSTSQKHNIKTCSIENGVW